MSAQAYFHALRAEVFSARGDEGAAAEALQLALVYDPDSYHLTIWLARLAWKIGRGARVERLVDRAMKLEPRKAGPWLLRGQIDRAAGSIAAAESAFERAMALEPATEEGAQAAIALAEIAEKRGQKERSIKILRRAFSKAADREVALSLADRHEKRGELDEAIAVLEKIGGDRLALLYERAGRFDEAARAHRDRIEKKSAECAEKTGTNLCPALAPFLIDAARAELFAGETPRAESLIAEAVRLDPSLSDRGREILAAREPPLEAPPIAAARDRAIGGDVDGAILLLEKQGEIEVAAQIEAWSGALQKAVDRLERAIRSGDPDHQLRLALAQLQARVGSAVRAERLAEVIAAEKPDELRALSLLARLRASRGARLAETDVRLVQASLQNPDHAELIGARGRLLFVMGRRDFGRRLLERSTKLDPNDPLIQEYLGDAWAARNDRARAGEAYDRAVMLYRALDRRCAPGAADRADRVEKKRARMR